VKIKSILDYTAIVLMVIVFSAVGAQAQEKQEFITVKNAGVSNGVVIVMAESEKVTIELQCNQDFVGCAVLKPGEYVMTRLAKNHGPYDCSNVTVYAKSPNPDASGEKLGTYCISEK